MNTDNIQQTPRGEWQQVLAYAKKFLYFLNDILR